MSSSEYTAYAVPIFYITRPTQTGVFYGRNNAGYIDLILACRRRTIELAQSQTDETSDVGTRREVADVTAWPQSVRRRLVHTDNERTVARCMELYTLHLCPDAVAT